MIFEEFKQNRVLIMPSDIVPIIIHHFMKAFDIKIPDIPCELGEKYLSKPGVTGNSFPG